MAIHRLVLIDGLLPVSQGVNNLLCDCEFCQYPTLTFQNQHNSTLTLTNAIIDTASFGTGIVVSIWSINGGAPTFPRTIPQNGTIQIQFEICYNFQNPPTNWSLTLVTAEHNNDLAYEFATVCDDLTGYFNQTSINFGAVEVGTTVQQTVQFTNYSMGTFFLSENLLGLCPGVSMNPPILNVPPGDTVNITFQWTPTGVGNDIACAACFCNVTCIDLFGTAIAPPLFHHFEITGDFALDASGNPNKFICCLGECATNRTEFLNIHSAPLNVTGLIINSVGSGVTVSILEIDNLPPSFPFTVPVGGLFTVTFEVCWDGVTSPLNPWSAYFTTQEFGDDLSWNFEMVCYDIPSDAWSTLSVDFGNVLVGVPSSQTIILQLNAGQTFNYLFDLLNSCGANVVVTSPIDLNEGYASVTITWTPTLEGETLSCSLDDNCGNIITLSGTAVSIICEECFCCADVTIKTENNYLPDENGFCVIDELYDKASFLEKKTVVFSMFYPAGINSSWIIQFNPALFITDCISPFDSPSFGLPTYYYHRYAQTLNPDGVAQQMVLVNGGSNANNQKNWECYFRPINAALGTFNIELTFYNIQDYEGFVSNLLFDNGTKLKRTTLSSTTDWANTMPSVYNSNKKLIGGSFFITDPTQGEDFVYCQNLVCVNYAARFYNRGLNNGVSEFLNPTWELSRTVGVVNELSILEKTRVTFTITVPPIYGVATPVCIYHLFDVTNVDNSLDFLTSTDSSRFRVMSYAGTGVLDNHLVRPGSTANINGNWVFYLNVGTTINPTSRYRMAAIVYGSNGTMVNTFLSPELTVKRTPDLDCDCVFDFDSTWLQYWQRQQSDFFRPSPKERIGHELNIQVGDFQNCLNNWGYEGDWRELLRNVTLNIYKKVPAFPNASSTTFFLYETHSSVRQVGFPGNYNNLNSLIVEDLPLGGIQTQILNRRVKWENIPFQPGLVQTANTATYMNRVAAGANTTTYINNTSTLDTWIEEDVYFEYVLRLHLRPITTVDFYWNIVKAFKVRAIDFEPITGYPVFLNNYFVSGRTSELSPWQMLGDEVCFKDWYEIKLTYQADREGNFIFFAEPEPFGLPLLQEHDETFSPNDMIELSSPMVVSMDTVFDPVTFRASVILNPQFMTAERYLFCGYISVPTAPQICEYFLRHQRFAQVGININPANQFGDSVSVSFPSISFGYAVLKVFDLLGNYPVVGQVYVFEWSFASPTTAAIDFWFGQDWPGGSPDLTLPIGSTSGSFSFTWTGSADGWWCFRQPAAPVMNTTAAFKIGNALCP